MPSLYTLAADTGCKVHLAVPVRGRIMYLGGFDDPSMPALYTHFGQTAPMHCTSVGKSILAFLPTAERDAIIAQLSFERFTPATITDPARFRAELEEVERQGYAQDNAEHKPDIYCIGVPIFSTEHRPLGGISLVGRQRDQLIREVDRLIRTGRLISQALAVSSGH
jgi:DNA-binding IclR family transcriptional regulator